jgi:hypothetical protein
MPAVGRAGAPRSAWWDGVVFALLLPLPLVAGSVVGLGAALLLFGAAHGLMDVAMKTAAAAAERDLGRSVMAAFHGWFSVGMVLGVFGGVPPCQPGCRRSGTPR